MNKTWLRLRNFILIKMNYDPQEIMTEIKLRFYFNSKQFIYYVNNNFGTWQIFKFFVCNDFDVLLRLANRIQIVHRFQKHITISMSPMIWFDLSVCYGCQFPRLSKKECNNWIQKLLNLLSHDYPLCFYDNCLCLITMKILMFDISGQNFHFGISHLKDVIRNRSLIPKQIQSIV